MSQLADGVIEADDYSTAGKAVTQAIAVAQGHLDALEVTSFDSDDAFSYLAHTLWNTRMTWETADLQGKQRIQQKLFPSGLPLTERGFGTPPSPSFYSRLAKSNYQELDLVAPQGFEPRLSESESLVLPLNERAIRMQENPA